MKFNKLIPELSVKDINTSLNFYCNILGFKLEYQRQESRFAFLSLEGAQIMIEELNGNWETGKLEYPFGRGINFQIEVSKIKPILSSLNKVKYPIFLKPKINWYLQGDYFLGTKEFLVKDPDGYLLRFSEDFGKKSIKRGKC